MEILEPISLVLTIIGALNWGMVGIFDFDVVAFIFGQHSTMSRLVYSFVGVGGLYLGINYLVKKIQVNK